MGFFDRLKKGLNKIRENLTNKIEKIIIGYADIDEDLLDEKDVLHTGIDILVTLPQKKRQSLAALSGGERALTVIALLFAFLRYRPSPFSVLD